jgi:hypothetical protein
VSEDVDIEDFNGSFSPLPNILVLLYQELKYLLEIEFKESESIINSANNVIGWNGLIISVLLTGGGLFISSEKVSLNQYELLLLILTIISFGVSISIIFVYQLRTPTIRIHSSHGLMNQLLQTQNTAEILGHLIEQIDEAIRTNQQVNQIKRGRIIKSQTAFLIGFIIAIGFLIYHSYILYIIDMNKEKTNPNNTTNDGRNLKYVLDKIKLILDKEHPDVQHPANDPLFMDRKWFKF